MRNTLMDMPTTYIVFDLEFIFDREGHARFMQDEPVGTTRSILWPFKHVVTASAMVVRVTSDEGERRLSVERFQTFGRPEQDEREIVGRLFGMIEDEPHAVVVTWGGAAMDLPVLRAAALNHGLRLPTQLHGSARHYRQPERRHLDLGISLKGDAKYVHLAEIALRIGVPTKMAMGANEVGAAAERGKWSLVKEQAEADTITTALLLGRHLISIGAVDSTAWGTDSAIVLPVLLSHQHRSYAATLRTWLDGRSNATIKSFSQAA